MNLINYGLGLMLLSFSVAQAESMPYLLQQISMAKPDAQAISKAQKQVAELQEQTLQKISLVPFHVRKAKPINDSKAYCTECHSPIPHVKRLRSRAFLNMHTDYIACETCHFRPQSPALHYVWYDYAQEKIIAGNPNLLHAGHKATDKLLPSRTGQLKIIPVLPDQMVIATREHSAAKALYQDWKAADKTRKATLKAQYHQPLQTKGPECKACHTGNLAGTQKSLLDLAVLGATPAQRTAIVQNSIADFFAHYQPDKLSGEAEDREANASQVPEERIKITQFLK